MKLSIFFASDLYRSERWWKLWDRDAAKPVALNSAWRRRKGDGLKCRCTKSIESERMALRSTNFYADVLHASGFGFIFQMWHGERKQLWMEAFVEARGKDVGWTPTVTKQLWQKFNSSSTMVEYAVLSKLIYGSPVGLSRQETSRGGCHNFAYDCSMAPYWSTEISWVQVFESQSSFVRKPWRSSNPYFQVRR